MALRAVPDHPKFADLMATLNLPKFATLGALEAVWHFAGRYAPQGNIGKYSDRAIETWVGWNGIAGGLIEALVKCRWIDRDLSHRLLVHDWDQHADKATKNALMRAKLPFCTPSVRTAGVQHTNRKPGSSAASRLPEPEPVPEPEASCAAASATPELLLYEGSPVALLTNTGKEWQVLLSDFRGWVEAYPGVDVMIEVLRAREWLAANLRNRKTALGMRRFLVNWLSRSQDSSRPDGRRGHRSPYRDAMPVPMKVVVPTEAEMEAEERNAWEMYQSMSATYKKANPWKGRVFA